MKIYRLRGADHCMSGESRIMADRFFVSESLAMEFVEREFGLREWEPLGIGGLYSGADVEIGNEFSFQIQSIEVITELD